MQAAAGDAHSSIAAPSPAYTGAQCIFTLLLACSSLIDSELLNGFGSLGQKVAGAASMSWLARLAPWDLAGFKWSAVLTL